MSDQPLPEPKRDWGKIALASLALNVFLLCGIGGYWLSAAFQEAPPQVLSNGGPARQFEFLASRLPTADGDVLRQEFYSKKASINAAHTEVHRTRDAVRQALSAEPYNAQATSRAIADAEAAHMRLDSLLQDVIASAAGKMSADGRSKLGDFQSRPPRREWGETLKNLNPLSRSRHAQKIGIVD